MCGRYASFREAQALADAFDVQEMTEAARTVQNSWNVAPTNDVRIVVDPPAEQTRSMHAARWGLVPHWSASPSVGARMINARAETVAEKPAFRALLRNRRCIVLADGYYEWHRYTTADGSERKQPYYIHPTGGEPIAFAGLYAWWADPDRDGPDRWLLSTTIITAAARDGLEHIHHREPVMLASPTVDRWLDHETPHEPSSLLAHPGPQVSWHPVTRAVGSVHNDRADLITAVPPPPELADDDALSG